MHSGGLALSASLNTLKRKLTPIQGDFFILGDVGWLCQYNLDL
jgi:hypothetical protein